MTRIVVAIPTWNDAAVLRGALESCAAAGLRSYVLDGRYETYGSGDWRTHPSELVVAAKGVPGVTVDVGIDRPWRDEAEKRTGLARLAGEHADWLLFLDADERLEGNAGALESWVARLPPAVLWAYVNIHAPDRVEMLDVPEPSELDATTGGRPRRGPRVVVDGGYRLPRLVRAVRGLEFRPPMDFDLHRGDQRIAYLPGESIPAALAEAWAEVPLDVLRIRHERERRPAERIEMTGEYVRERRRLHGVG